MEEKERDMGKEWAKDGELAVRQKRKGGEIGANKRERKGKHALNL